MTPSQEKSNQAIEQTLARDVASCGDDSAERPSRVGGENSREVALSEKISAPKNESVKPSLDSMAADTDRLAWNKPRSVTENSLEEKDSHPPSENKPLNSISIMDTTFEIGSPGQDGGSKENTNESNEAQATTDIPDAPDGGKRVLCDESSPSLDTFKPKVDNALSQRPSNAPSGPPKIIHTEIQNLPISLQPLSSGYTSPAVMPALPKGKTLRRGKWTVEEEAYVARVIQDFNSGFLNAPAGTTLRSYLSEKLQCDPMRITKKFTGDACIGKRVFHPAVRSAGNASTIDRAQAELDALERRWRRRLEMQQREAAKKAAASAAAVHTTPQDGRVHLVQGVPVALLDSQGVRGSVGDNMHQTVVTQAASWLDRANAILGGSKPGGNGVLVPTRSSPGDPQSFENIACNEIESQMQEVRRLIYEGPLIQQTAAGLPHLLSYDTRENTATNMNRVPLAGEQNVQIEPADKRLRRTSVSGAEDAEALVGFLRSVRASAASGQDVSN